MKRIILVVLCVGALVALMPLLLLSGTSTDQASTAGGNCTPLTPNDTADADLTLDAVQQRNAVAIITAGKAAQVDPAGWVVAIATSLQEAGLRNLPSKAVPESLSLPHDTYPGGAVPAGDHDSVGLFQQRTAWAPTTVRMDPVPSATMFYTGGRAGQRGLLDIPNWQTMDVTEAAQAVQVSAYPMAYARWEATARKTVRELGGADVAIGCSTDVGEPVTGIPSDTRWVNPLAPTGARDYVLTARFGQCSSLWARCHTGLDFSVPTGTPVHAMSAGKVIAAGPAGAYGNLVKVQHSDRLITYYAHNSAVRVSAGQTVTTGQVIALSGATGNVTGPHVHLETRVNDRPTDPEAFMTDRDVDY